MAHHHAPASHNPPRQRLAAAFAVTFVFMLVEALGGWISGSLALLADAGHMLTDTAALLMALLAVQFAQRKPTGRYTFGLLRLTTLAAFVNAIALLVITLLIVWEALQRFYHPQPVTGALMFVIAIAGLLANLFSLWLLRTKDQEEQNLNVRAATLHVMGDLLGSVGAIVAALIILFTGWTPIDPILSLLVSLLVVRSAWSLLRESLHELLEGAPREIDRDKLARDLVLNIAEVRSVHHVHLWQVGEKPLLTLHAQVIPPYDHDALLQRIHDYLQQKYHFEHATVQMEYQPCALHDCRLSETAAAAPHHHHH